MYWLKDEWYTTNTTIHCRNLPTCWNVSAESFQRNCMRNNFFPSIYEGLYMFQFPLFKNQFNLHLFFPIFLAPSESPLPKQEQNVEPPKQTSKCYIVLNNKTVAKEGQPVFYFDHFFYYLYLKRTSRHNMWHVHDLLN